MSITTTEIFVTNPKVKKKITELFEKKEQKLIEEAKYLRSIEADLRKKIKALKQKNKK